MFLCLCNLYNPLWNLRKHYRSCKLFHVAFFKWWKTWCSSQDSFKSAVCGFDKNILTSIGVSHILFLLAVTHNVHRCFSILWDQLFWVSEETRGFLLMGLFLFFLRNTTQDLPFSLERYWLPSKGMYFWRGRHSFERSLMEVSHSSCRAPRKRCRHTKHVGREPRLQHRQKKISVLSSHRRGNTTALLLLLLFGFSLI